MMQTKKINGKTKFRIGDGWVGIGEHVWDTQRKGCPAPMIFLGMGQMQCDIDGGISRRFRPGDRLLRNPYGEEYDVLECIILSRPKVHPHDRTRPIMRFADNTFKTWKKACDWARMDHKFARLSSPHATKIGMAMSGR